MLSKKIFFTLSLFFGLLLPSCGPVENSSTLDKVLYGGTFDSPDATPLFSSVRSSLTKCQTCHGSWLSLSEAEFVSLGLVTAKSADASKLYYRNAGATSGPGPQNMPSGGYPALTTEELQTMVSWINSL